MAKRLHAEPIAGGNSPEECPRSRPTSHQLRASVLAGLAEARRGELRDAAATRTYSFWPSDPAHRGCRLTSSAERAIAQTIEHVERRHGTAAASRCTEDFARALLLLAAHPGFGYVHPAVQMSEDIRVIPVGLLLLAHVEEADSVTIVCVGAERDAGKAAFDERFAYSHAKHPRADLIRLAPSTQSGTLRRTAR